MKPHPLVRRIVSMQLVLLRLDWITGLAWLLVTIGITGWLWLVPRLQTEIHHQKPLLLRLQNESTRITSALPRTHSPDAQRLAKFYDALGDTASAEQPLKILFAIAARNGLTLTQADYQSTVDHSGKYSTYQIILPVKAPYPAIRAFCEQVLLAIPYAALEEIRFKRETIASPTLEAQLRLRLFLRDAGHATSGVPVPEATP